MTRFISHFTLITVIPALLLIGGAVLGGWWPLAAVFYLTAFKYLADRVVDGVHSSPLEPWLKTALPVGLAVLHFLLLWVAVWSLATKPGDWPEKLFVFIGFGLFFATVSNANGHELIHRRTRFEHALGRWIFISHLFGHHTSAHLLVHHPYVATPYDPNSARLNESFYRFWRRAWKGSFMTGLMAENARRGLPDESRKITPSNPYFQYIAGAVGFVLLVWLFAGPKGVAWYLALALVAQTGLLVTDYVQHYGLQRRQFADGKFEATGPRHSWNAPHWFTRHLTLNATRHSDHHAKPAKPYTELLSYPPDVAPELPYPAGTMSMIALIPRLWRKVMNPRVLAVREWQDAKTGLSNSA